MGVSESQGEWEDSSSDWVRAKSIPVLCWVSSPSPPPPTTKLLGPPPLPLQLWGVGRALAKGSGALGLGPTSATNSF